MRVGLTGGIASGKSTTAHLLQAWGAHVIDSDQLAHDAIAPGQPAHREIVEHFGNAVLNPDGTINRPRLGEIVFADDAQRARLNQIVHPRVRAQWQKQTEAIEATSPHAFAVAMIPLLYETQVESAFDTVLAVGCSPETQRARLRSRGLQDEQIAARLRSQLPAATKMDRADFVIWNDYSLAILEQQTRMVWHSLSTLAN
jgi:dephospho-CoA kinase